MESISAAFASERLSGKSAKVTMAEVLNNENDVEKFMFLSSDSSDEDEPLANLMPLHLPGTFFL